MQGRLELRTPRNLNKRQAIWQTFRVEFTLTKLQEEYSGQIELEINYSHSLNYKSTRGIAK